jgi:hypothetical protein
MLGLVYVPVIGRLPLSGVFLRGYGIDRASDEENCASSVPAHDAAVRSGGQTS